MLTILVNKMKKEETTHVRIRLTTKKKLDMLSEYLGINLVDVLKNAIGVYQASIILSNMDRGEKQLTGEGENDE